MEQYIQSFSDKYGKVTNLIWISKKRRKYVLEFAYTRMLVINDEVYKFKDIISCKVEKAVSLQRVRPFPIRWLSFIPCKNICNTIR